MVANGLNNGPSSKRPKHKTTYGTKQHKLKMAQGLGRFVDTSFCFGLF
jgi:hypothetical protein